MEPTADPTVTLDATPRPLGRVVLYTLTEQDAVLIASRRAALAFPAGVAGQHNPVHPGDTYPAIVVKTFGDHGANLQVFLDGADTYWATSRTEGEPGKWGHWTPAEA